MRTDRELAVVVDHDTKSAASLASALSMRNRDVVTVADAAGARAILPRLHARSVFTDTEISGPWSFDAIEVVDAAQQVHDCRVVLTGRSFRDDIAEAASRRGVRDLFPKPYDAGDIARQCCGGSLARHRGTVRRLPTMPEILASSELRPSFQPIVDLRPGVEGPFAFESLARLNADLVVNDARFLFDYARLCGSTTRLDRSLIERSFAEARHLPARARIFLNLHPDNFREMAAVEGALRDASRASSIDLDRVVLEITEQGQFDDGFDEDFERLRSLGIEFALDDVGSSWSHLHLLDRIRPRYLKIGAEFGSSFHEDVTTERIVRSILDLARELDTEVVIEGIETEAGATAVAEIGARFAQGFHYAKPAPAETFSTR